MSARKRCKHGNQLARSITLSEASFIQFYMAKMSELFLSHDNQRRGRRRKTNSANKE